MTSPEQQLYARAEMLEETSDLAADASQVLAGAGSAGVDPRAVTHLADAIRELDPAGSVPAYDAGSSSDRHPGGGYASDVELLEALSDLEGEIIIRHAGVHRLREDADAALDKARDDLGRAQRDLKTAREDLAAALAMPVKEDCDGCHGQKGAAIAAAEAVIAGAEKQIADAEKRISIVEDTAEVLGPLSARLTAAAESLRKVPHDLGEVYQLVYEFIRGGGKLPALARWIEGQGAPA